MAFTHDGDTIPNAPSKDPDSTVEYGCDWSDWLGADTIAGSVWVLPAGLTEVSSANSTTVATIVISGGTVGTRYTITNRITTAAGMIEDRSMIISCREK